MTFQLGWSYLGALTGPLIPMPDDSNILLFGLAILLIISYELVHNDY